MDNEVLHSDWFQLNFLDRLKASHWFVTNLEKSSTSMHISDSQSHSWYPQDRAAVSHQSVHKRIIKAKKSSLLQ